MLSFVIRNTFLTLAVAVGLAVAGFWGWRHVPVDAIPDLSDNQVIVWAEWPGKSPQDMDLQVTSRLTRELQGLSGVQTVRGMSLYGASYLYVINTLPAWDPLAGTALPSSATGTTFAMPSSPSARYFHVRAKDVAGNWGPTRTFGPLLVNAATVATYCTAKISSVWLVL